jgi:uncharacterized protein YuzE
MKLTYDKRADVLYITFKDTKHVSCLEGQGDVLVRIDPTTDDVVGFTILNFTITQSILDKIGLPFVVDSSVTTKLITLIHKYERELIRRRYKALPYNLRFQFCPPSRWPVAAY